MKNSFEKFLLNALKFNEVSLFAQSFILLVQFAFRSYVEFSFDVILVV